MKIERPRGTHDILPSEQPLWRKVTAEMERVCALYGYRRIQTPVFEDAQLFSRTSGVGSDIVQKEMYYLADRTGENRFALRPEATAPICRAYIEHGMKQEPQPAKLYTLGSFYRYDRPQRGRYREHHQLSVECIGSAVAAVDAEVIQLYDMLLTSLGVSNYELHLNSSGDRTCRPEYERKLRDWLGEHDNLLTSEVEQKRATNVLRVFDVKDPTMRALLEGAPKITDHLCGECARHFEEVRALLDSNGVRYVLDPTVVRGLDYYSRTTWEFVGPDDSSQGSTISGGGRYDYLIEQIGGPPTPGVGFGAGIERLIMSLELEGITAEEDPLDVYVAVAPDTPPVQPLLARLRAEGFAADADYAGRSMKGQISQGQKRARAILIVSADGMMLRRQGELDVEVDEATLMELLRA
ncbi:MAG TPA: histidine--tRNA ligase [Gaiellaceae bacterium]